MRVLLVSTERGWQGGERQALLLARGLTNRGHECVLLARDDGRLLGRARAEGLETSALAGAGQSPRGWMMSRRLLLSFGAEVVHFNDPRALTAAGPVALALPRVTRIASRRVVFPLRNPWLYRRVCHQILCVSEAVRQRCLEAGLPAHMLRVVHDGVDRGRVGHGDAAALREELGLSPAAPVLLVLAALAEAKGHADLLAAAVTLLPRFPELQLLFAGEGSERDALATRAAALGLQDHVHFLGLRDDIADLLAVAALLVLPSREEGLGSSLIEAMLAGTPVLGTTAGGIPELIGPRDGEEAVGWLVPPAEPAALAAGIAAALQAGPEQERRAALATRRALRRFTAEAMVEGTLTAYREAAGQR